MDVAIYALFDPREPLAIRYVGKTQQSLAARLGAHIREARTGAQSYRYKWLRFVLAAGIRPEIKLIESVSTESWKERERHWISKLRIEGHPLTNGSAGGDGLESADWKELWSDPARRARQSAALIAYNADPAVRAKKTADNKRRFADPDARARHGARMRAVASSAEVRASRSVATAASWKNVAARQRRIDGIRARFSTEDARAKKSAAMKRRWSDPAHRARQSEKSKARWADPEQRQRIIEANRAAKRPNSSDTTKRGWATRRANAARRPQCAC